jgi:hypothetical protein
VTGPGVKPGVERTHLIDLYDCAAACKAVYAGSIPTPASKNQILSSSYAHVESPRVVQELHLATREIDLATRHMGLFAADASSARAIR